MTRESRSCSELGLMQLLDLIPQRVFSFLPTFFSIFSAAKSEGFETQFFFFPLKKIRFSVAVDTYFSGKIRKCKSIGRALKLLVFGVK